MGWRFRRTAQIFPGLRLGITHKGASLRVGPRGLGWTINTKGQQRISAGIPGTGLHYSEAIGAKPPRGRRRAAQAIEAMPAEPYPWEVEEDRQRREMQVMEAGEFGFLDYAPPAPPKPSIGHGIGKAALWGFAIFGALCPAMMVLGSR